ncbi:F-box protein [Carex littledalei]|uniref:F-box protein n=1 Tax=Carex littledalei TaxID=544730 RepID=A0A833R1S4_9POAL|nr:F-box protein [Carex littledalei]
MASPPSTKKHKDLPVHLIHQRILPCLPFKCLSRYKCVSKEIYSLISTDAKFAADQSRLANTSSSGFVYMTRRGLSFFPDPTLIGVPNPSLKFLNPTSIREIKLVSSTNGLLLLYGEFNGMKSHCVCNPATKEMVVVPNAVNVVGEKFDYTEMGLAYDPCESPDRFTIVHPLMYDRRDGSHGAQYQFDVFRSDTGKWTRSSQRISIYTISAAVKPLCAAKGVIYWCCGKYLLWYDIQRDIAGSLSLPEIRGVIDVGVCASEITFCCASSSQMEVWTLNGRGWGSPWELTHAEYWDSMADVLGFCPGLDLRYQSMFDMNMGRTIRPVGFDGQFIYIAVRLKHRDKTEKLFSWDLETGRVEGKGVITIKGSWREDQAFNYVNSMARVPQVFNVTS